MQLTRAQQDKLQGLYIHITAVTYDGVKADYAFHAAQLDEAGVPWTVQNAIACAAEKRENHGLYFSTVLKKEVDRLTKTV